MEAIILTFSKTFLKKKFVQPDITKQARITTSVNNERHYTKNFKNLFKTFVRG
jgi:hypothetical protein